jgi:predicted N-acetyltransferase YhbS
MNQHKIISLTKEKFQEAVDLVVAADLDTREEIEHHLEDINAHFVALNANDKIIGVIGWYQDTVNYANEAMGDAFPGEDAYWVGFFAVDIEQRGEGIGFALINKLQETLNSKGVSELWVSSVPESADYYARQGFEKITEGKISDSLKIFMVKRW